ncbi:aminotransferase class III-fold pyridoxal phosphate-dependent enzyme [Allorhodopirellula heiligendammensis]|uniref:Putrescine aminotransferase n=1 Tax=Allorhodopirellula heiligendammensis TaxID=2714739 RepID=A0A5C6BIR6_9BACT|nr:aminotransferase class III-fold pyridoxal phosphate-dependent enzyme [Allorhodopirellula heiligendammensis]TWU11099.1 Putrescine aminotransferase [Allorhodopirellula heiligendammensis]
MSESQHSTPWLNALAGTISATGRDCEYLTEASARWAQSQWSGEDSGLAIAASDLAERLRVLTGQDERGIATCLNSASVESLLQWAVVLCRLHHQSATESSGSGETNRAGARCLAAVGSDHGGGIVGRMASGRADSRSPAWPLVPGFTHSPLESLAERIDHNVAMVLVSPIDVHDRMLAIPGDQLLAISEACQRHGASLVIDHSRIPPQGGQFWVHEAIAPVTADAVLMSAGLTGGAEGGLLTLSSPLAKQVTTLAASVPELSSSSWIAAIAAATLDQWIEHSWCDAAMDGLATELAGRMAGRECVRDLHVTGRAIGMELDIPAVQWAEAAAEHQLGVATAGEFAVAMQPPLILSSDDITTLCNRVDQVFDWIEMEEQQPAEAPSQSVESPPAESPTDESSLEESNTGKSVPEESPQQTIDDSEYDVNENDSLDDDFDEELRPDDENHSPAMNIEPEIQS